MISALSGLFSKVLKVVGLVKAAAKWASGKIAPEPERQPNPWKNPEEGKPFRSVPFTWDKGSGSVSGAKSGEGATGGVAPEVLTEFNLPKIVDYKRMRAAIEHENSLLNHRMTWLLSANAFLFSAFFLAMSAVFAQSPDGFLDHIRNVFFPVQEKPLVLKPYYVLPLGLIIFLGLVVSAVIYTAIKAATTQIQRLEEWWHAHYVLGRGVLSRYTFADEAAEKIRYELLRYQWDNYVENDQPPINGIFRTVFYKLLSIQYVPAWCAFIWLSLGLLLVGIASTGAFQGLWFVLAVTVMSSAFISWLIYVYDRGAPLAHRVRQRDNELLKEASLRLVEILEQLIRASGERNESLQRLADQLNRLIE